MDSSLPNGDSPGKSAILISDDDDSQFPGLIEAVMASQLVADHDMALALELGDKKTDSQESTASVVLVGSANATVWNTSQREKNVTNSSTRNGKGHGKERFVLRKVDSGSSCVRELPGRTLSMISKGHF